MTLYLPDEVEECLNKPELKRFVLLSCTHSDGGEWQVLHGIVCSLYDSLDGILGPVVQRSINEEDGIDK